MYKIFLSQNLEYNVQTYMVLIFEPLLEKSFLGFLGKGKTHFNFTQKKQLKSLSRKSKFYIVSKAFYKHTVQQN